MRNRRPALPKKLGISGPRNSLRCLALKGVAPVIAAGVLTGCAAQSQQQTAKAPVKPATPKQQLTTAYASDSSLATQPGD